MEAKAKDTLGALSRGLVAGIDALDSRLDALSESPRKTGILELKRILEASQRFLNLLEPKSHADKDSDEDTTEAERCNYSIPSEPTSRVRWILSRMFHLQHPNLHWGFLMLTTECLNHASIQAVNVAALCLLEGLGTKVAPDAALYLLEAIGVCDAPERFDVSAAMRSKALLATCYLYMGRTEKGETLLHAAVKARDAYALLVFGRGRLGNYNFVADIDGAIKLFKRALKTRALAEDPVVAELARLELYRLHLTAHGLKKVPKRIGRVFASPNPKVWYEASQAVIEHCSKRLVSSQDELRDARAKILEAAEARYLPACRDVGRNYARNFAPTVADLGLSPDSDLALRYFSYAASQGDSRAESYVNKHAHNVKREDMVCVSKGMEQSSTQSTQDLPQTRASHGRVGEEPAYESKSPVGGSPHTMTMTATTTTKTKTKTIAATTTTTTKTSTTAEHNDHGPTHVAPTPTQANSQIDAVSGDEGGTNASKKTFEQYYKSADEGDRGAQLHLGNCYYHGQDVEQDYQKAFEWYFKSAEQGDSEAACRVGDCYYLGRGVARDHDKACEWYFVSAAHQNSDAQCSLGHCYMHCQGLFWSQHCAAELYTESASRGNSRGEVFLALCYLHRVFVGQDINKGLELLSRNVTRGNPLASKLFERHVSQWKAIGDSTALFALGCCYYYGYGVEQDYKKAFEYYSESARNDPSVGQYGLGNCYYYGHGVQQDFRVAFECFYASAKHGHTAAQIRVGDCYYYGRGVRQDFRVAFEYYSRSAKKGNAAAQNRLADCYYYGHGVRQDFRVAFEYYSLSAKKGNAAAQNRLGDCYYHGDGVEQDYEQAFEWYSKSAAQGNALAQHHVGDCYFHGHGVAQDHKKAAEGYSKMADPVRTTSAPPTIGWEVDAECLASAPFPVKLDC